MSKTEDGVIFAIVNDKNQVLIEERPPTDEKYAGLEIVLGGGVDPDETVPHALERELKEETGLRKFRAQPLGLIEYPSEGHFHHIFLVRPMGRVRNMEGESVQKWVNLKKAEKRLPLETSKIIVRMARKAIS